MLRTLVEKLGARRSDTLSQRCEPQCRHSCKTLPSYEVILRCGACKGSAEHKCRLGAPYYPLSLQIDTWGRKRPSCIVDGAPCPVAPEGLNYPGNMSFTPLVPLGAWPAPPLPAQLSAIFSARRVALLLVGQAFRAAGHSACVDSPPSVRSQQEVAEGYVSRVCRPLEDLGARVDVLFTFPRCEGRGSGGPATPSRTSLLSQMRSWYGKRVAAVWEIDSMGAGDGLAHGHLLLSSHARLRNVSYDYVLQARHDVMLTQPITAWPADFRKVLFEQQCWLVCHAARHVAPFGCACGSGHPFIRSHVHHHKAEQMRTDLCPASGCAADRLLWVPQRFLPLVSMLVQFNAGQRAGGVVSHTFLGYFLYVTAMSGLGGRDNVGFMFPPSTNEPQYADLHMRRGRLETEIANNQRARQAFRIRLR